MAGMLPSFCRETVTVSRARMVKERGTEVADWSQPTRHEIVNCDVQPAASSTAWSSTSQSVTVRLVLRVPPGSDIRAGDKVTVDGVDYAVEGAPHRWPRPSGGTAYVEVQLVDWRD